MNRLILTISFLGLLFTSCGDNAGGNKSIFSTKESESDEVTTTASENEANNETEKKASELNYTFQFTAFKTPAKKGVNGTFTEIKLTDTQKGDNLETSLKGAKFTINTGSISTGDVARDASLKTAFFEKLSGKEISGSFDGFENGKVKTTLTMNGKTKSFDFGYTSNAEGIVISGTIDIIKDFAGETALASLTETCKVQHEGKTWSDVNLVVTIKK